ncbi:beta-1,3-galactosyltransferase 5-like [Centruroides sculpturatus]|uniref:beta-1,3-galactosyltransferase 5-like n=1 Tax=Centruroides sculpturatus TaxID=218467 RepID=UPI000C6E99F1|nr:beta-1,3-galactosyltransferase 5-like [Centruroides sculpturatus]XP_023235639.1 beta-1,3-galactosyltransferase 5-like [Centruroides sculpturatus]XP_023235640.1 beta-1,3-galactosyltransferase 5-like [Centruroides sculpturatus]XP_023235641.1 beta-1,3-galactosyltransferase 5-like [Centruroides sculpturatus]
MKPPDRKRHFSSWHILIIFIIVYIINSIWYIQQFNPTSQPKPLPSIHWWKKSYENYNLTYINLTTDFDTLIDYKGFKFLLNSRKCDDQPKLFLIIFVHSSPTHFQRRATIRSTWGKDRTVAGKSVRLVFMLGTVNDLQLQQSIIREQQLFGDLVQGNFVDSYRNLTYKHVMGLKWVTYFCRQVKYILKTDDDVYVDIFQFISYLYAAFGYFPSPNLMMCFVIPSPNPKRSQRSKWRVSFKEYRNQKYPPYCSGWAIVTSPDVVFRLYIESFRVPYFWVDDVYVSGILAQKLNIHHIDLTYKLAITNQKITQWLEDDKLSLPSLFGYPDMDISTINALWKKTLHYYMNKDKQILQ